MTAIRKVCVHYQPTGHGLALAISESGGEAGTALDGVEVVDRADAVLRVSDGGVTLELPPVDGRRPVLAWDPAEVAWDAFGGRP
ncbi:MAG: hypothetical protein WBM50_11320 [Acidimicrobiales bacterium]